MASVMKVMSQAHGHKTLEWDTKADPDSARVDLARAEFEQLVKGEGRFRAYNVAIKHGKREGAPIKEFPPTREQAPEDHNGPVLEDVEELLLVPPLAGGS